MLRGFSRKSVYAFYQFGRSLLVLLGFSRVCGFAYTPYTYAFQRAIPSARGSSRSPSSLHNSRWHGNLNPFSIGFAFRLILRTRLTLGGLTSPRNPWVIGGRGSHPSFATHVRICACLSSSIPHRIPSPVETMLPYHSFTTIRCFGDVLEPR